MAAHDDIVGQIFEQLLTLPQRAQVAFAARCARRVLPLFPTAWPAAPADFVDAIELAVKSAELFAAGRAHADAAVAASACAAAKGAHAAILAAIAENAAEDTAHAAAAATNGALAAETNYTLGGDSVTHAFAAHAAAYSACAVDSTHFSLLVSTIHYDLEQLHTAAHEHGWNDDTPVSSDFFGALWPVGEPDGGLTLDGVSRNQKIRAHGPCVRPEFEILIDPGDASKDTIKGVLDALSDLHIACGGLGLEFKTDGLSVYALEGVTR